MPTPSASRALGPDFRALFESSPGLYLVLSPTFQIVAVSDAYLKATMTRREDIIGKALFEVFPDNPNDPQASGVKNLSASLNRVLKNMTADTMPVQKYDVRRPASEGGQFEERYWSPVNSPVFGHNRQVAYIIHRVEDVTEMIRLQHLGTALRESEEQYRALFENNPQPMWVYDRSTLQFLMVNDAAVAHYGYTRDEFLAMTLKDIRPEAEVPKFLEAHNAQTRPMTMAGTWRHRKKNGRPIEVEIVEHRLQFGGREAGLVLVTDVTERLTLERQFRQAQKMEAIGRLAGGVAHDFNNLLGVIMGSAELAVLKNPNLDAATTGRLNDIQRAAERAAALTRQLLAFSRQQVLQPEQIDLSRIVQGIEKMLHRLIGEHIDLRINVKAGLPRCQADPGQMEQVIMNLVINARDAMPTGGTMSIHTDIFEADYSYTRTHGDVRPGTYVVMAVSDTGVGMDAETQLHIFEPFFTTKEVGKGTGLGLAMVYGIVKQSGGFIWLYSEKGLGTTFKLYFPMTSAQGERTSPKPVSLEKFAGKETILLVEDEKALRETTQEFLEASGYTVLQAGNADEALTLANNNGHIHLLLTDVVMPGKSGRQLAEQLTANAPKLRVLYMTGYTDDMVVQHGVLQEGVALVQKPFTRAGLLKRVRDTLDSSR